MRANEPANDGIPAWSARNRTLVGRTLGSTYRVVRPIGAGGMGQVFLAEQLNDHSLVAVKLLVSGAPYSSVALSRFLREAEVLESLDHPGIVRALDVSHVASEEPVLVIELLEGLTFKQLLDGSGPIPWRWAVDAVCQILDALHAAHVRGLIHRDVKPSNCFAVSKGPPLAGPPQTKIIDFGVAKLRLEDHPAEAKLTASGQLLGTPAYCAPEQAVGHEIDARADVYSVGATLYELLTATLPFAGRTAADFAVRQLSERPRAPSAVNPGMGIPDELDRVVLCALQRTASDRYSSALDMRDALRGVLAGTSASPTLNVAATSVSRPVRSTSDSAASDPSFDDDQLRRLEGNVERFWIRGVLMRSVEGGRMAPQLRTYEEQWLQGPASSYHSIEPPPPTAVPAEVTMEDLFADSAGRLLIVGGPGGGKTTALLNIAKGLIDRVSLEPRKTPVVFTLSAWDGRERSLVAWMAAELESKYRVPSELGRRWLRDERLIPLLDGLDEVPPLHRASCVRAINDHVQAHPTASVAVSSRLEEYQELPERLRLESAIRLHDLSDGALRDFVAGHPARETLEALLREESVAELARRPLVLGLLSHMASGDPEAVAATAESEGDRLGQILDKYVASMLTRAGKRRLPKGMGLVAQLQRLAWEMRRRSLATFHLEALQPDWLRERGSRWAYVLLTRTLGSVLFGLAVILPYGMTPLSNMGFEASLMSGAWLGLWTAVTGACTAGSLDGVRIASMSVGNHKLAYPLRLILLAVAMGAVTALLAGFRHHYALALMGAQTGAILAALLYPHRGAGLATQDIRLRAAVAFSVRHALRALPVAMATSAVGGLAVGMAESIRSGIVFAVLLCLLWVAVAGIRGRRVEHVASANVAVLGSLRTAAARSSTIAGLVMLPLAFAYSWSYAVYASVGVLATMWLWYGGYSAIQHGVLRALLLLEGSSLSKPSLLDAAADRGLLHRVGGGYLFIHPLLKTHLADQFETIRANGVRDKEDQ